MKVAGASPLDFAQDADVCVIGSGPAGAVAAVALAEHGHRVVLVEAGGDRNRIAPSEGIGRMDADGDADTGFGRVFAPGGSSGLWAGRVSSFDPIDFAARNWVPSSGWPLRHTDLAPYVERAWSLLGVDTVRSCPPAEPPGPWSSLLAGGELELKHFAWAREPFRVALWLEARRPRLDNLLLLTDTVVTSIQTGADGRAARAHVRAHSGEPHTLAARVFILAAGGIETARILLNSATQDDTVLGHGRQNVGRYFSTHPKADIATLHLSRREPTSHPLYRDESAGDGRRRAGIGFSALAQERHRLLNHYVQFSPVSEFRASRAFELAKGHVEAYSPFIDRHAVARGLLPGIGLMMLAGIGRVARLQPRAKTLVVRAFLDQFPEPENRITLSSETDRFGVPRADIRWRFGDRDKRSVVDFLRLLDARLVAAKVGRLDYSRLEAMSHWPLTAIHSHFMGATRMGTDPGHSVVDADCRVHGIPNLYIGGPSVFPTYGYANPFLSTTALSLRLADHIHRHDLSARK
jgi:choline dehydrogenase-like flavoprotein